MATLFGLAYLGRDAELRYTPKAEAITNLSLAFEYGQRGEDNKRPVQWIDAALWGTRAERLASHLKKGRLLSVTIDDIHIEQYEGRDGKASKLVGTIGRIEFAGERGGGQRNDSAPASAPATARAPAPRQAAKPPASSTGTGFDDMDSDIPF